MTLKELIEWADKRRVSAHLSRDRADFDKCYAPESNCGGTCLKAQAVADLLRGIQDALTID